MRNMALDLYSGDASFEGSEMSNVEVKEIDEQGRLIIPKKWRSMVLKGDKVVLRLKENSIEIEPWKKPDLTRFFDSVEADVKSDLSDWRAVRRELRRRPDEVR